MYLDIKPHDVIARQKRECRQLFVQLLWEAFHCKSRHVNLDDSEEVVEALALDLHYVLVFNLLIYGQGLNVETYFTPHWF